MSFAHDVSLRRSPALYLDGILLPALPDSHYNYPAFESVFPDSAGTFPLTVKLRTERAGKLANEVGVTRNALERCLPLSECFLFPQGTQQIYNVVSRVTRIEDAAVRIRMFLPSDDVDAIVPRSSLGIDDLLPGMLIECKAEADLMGNLRFTYQDHYKSLSLRDLNAGLAELRPYSKLRF